jgi:uncharacterized protein with GYD domain
MAKLMWFVRLVKLRNPLTKETNEWMNKKRAEVEKWGVKYHTTLHTLGRYDVVAIFEAPDEKTAMRVSIAFAPQTKAETLTAIPRDEVSKWL